MQTKPPTSSDSLVRLSLKGLDPAMLTGDFLKQGEMILARVISSGSRGDVMLQMGDMQLAALTRSSVTVGDIVNLKVISVGREALLLMAPQSAIKNEQPGVEPWLPPSGSLRLLSLSSSLPLVTDQTVDARVVVETQHNGIVRLSIGQKEYEGISAKALKQGEAVTLKVVSGGREPILQIISTSDLKKNSVLGLAEQSKVLLPPVNSEPSLKPQFPPIRLLATTILKDLSSGDLLVARVIANHHKGELVLQVGDEVINAATKLQMSKGEQLYLRVIKGGAEPQAEQIDIKQYLQQIKLAAYRTILPRQHSLAESFEILINALKGKSDTLPENIRGSIEMLLKQLPTADKVARAQQLRQLIGNTGLFTEAKLLTGIIAPGDLKIALNQIMAMIRPLLAEQSDRPAKGGRKAVIAATQGTAVTTPLVLLGELMRSSEGAIAKIQAQQLASLPQDDSTQQVWHFQLPIYHNDKVELLTFQIEHEKKSCQEDTAVPWSITLQMNLSPLGPMRAQIRLKGQEVSTTFWAEEQDTLTLVNQNLPTLRGALERTGLKVAGLRVLHGMITPLEERRSADLSLLDVKV
jgi:hypothetical protein